MVFPSGPKRADECANRTRSLEPLEIVPIFGIKATCLLDVLTLVGVRVVFASGLAVIGARDTAMTGGGDGGGAAPVCRGAGEGLRAAFGGTGILLRAILGGAGIAVRGSVAMDFAFFIAGGGARSGSCRFAEARDFVLKFCCDFGLVLALILVLAADFITEDSSIGAAARLLRCASKADFGVTTARRVVLRADWRCGFRSLVRFDLFPGCLSKMRCPGLNVLPGKSRTRCSAGISPLYPSSTEKSTWTGLPPRAPRRTVRSWARTAPFILVKTREAARPHGARMRALRDDAVKIMTGQFP